MNAFLAHSLGWLVAVLIGVFGYFDAVWTLKREAAALAHLMLRARSSTACVARESTGTLSEKSARRTLEQLERDDFVAFRGGLWRLTELGRTEAVARLGAKADGAPWGEVLR